ncbi:glycosyltransferase family 4 protein [Kitasatospora sp. NPDC056783]|uniref:glycosyltransferase family 4 protein n=1 Tax=Kitasatospora sp. NPDC056783 TaxID=3345943 RepID=UPI0036A86B1B
MARILALTDSAEDVRHFCRGDELFLFRIGLLPPREHSPERFEEIYRTLKASCDLSTIDVIVAEYVEALPLLYLMRRDGYLCPALMIPHTNPYPLHILFYFLLLAEHPHPADLVVCGSRNAQRAYEHLTGIRAGDICTFGIKDLYRRKDRAESRRRLGLPPDHTILLYTGRFMNDKGLEPLLAGYERLRDERPRTLLAMSVTHIDPPYYNRLAARLRDVVLFHRLEKERTVDLYNAADLFVSGATSIFETYGKSPLEALACGIPVVVPRWDGFPYFIGEEQGGLVDVEYLSRPQANPYEFARMDDEHFAQVCRKVLDRGQPPPDGVPEWATYERSTRVLTGVIERMAAAGRTRTPPVASSPLATGRYPAPVRAVLAHHGLRETEDLFAKAGALGLLNGTLHPDEALLRDLHHEVFKTMDAETADVRGPRT